LDLAEDLLQLGPVQGLLLQELACQRVEGVAVLDRISQASVCAASMSLRTSSSMSRATSWL
jgi:hypothetical protein